MISRGNNSVLWECHVDQFAKRPVCELWWHFIECLLRLLMTKVFLQRDDAHRQEPLSIKRALVRARDAQGWNPDLGGVHDRAVPR